MATHTEPAPPEDAAPPPLSTDSTPAGPPDRGPDRQGADTRRSGLAAVLLPVILVLVAGGLRLYNLDTPDNIYFDETYYAQDAAQYLTRGVEEGFAVHPPVGKWVIAAGIAALGDNPWGWRVPVALMGTATVLLTYLAGLRLFRRRGIAALAALLLAVDGLALTMSRIAMLDATLALLVVLAFWLLLVDRDRVWAGVSQAPPASTDDDDPLPLPRRPRLFRLLAGLALGLAVATKWSGLLAIGSAGLFLLGSELAWRRRTTGRVTAGWGRLVVGTGLSMIVLPAVVYLASYAGWFANFDRTRLAEQPCTYSAEVCARPVLRATRSFLTEQREIARFHATLDAEHPYRSLAIGWPVLARPIAYHYASCTDDLLAAGECEVEPGNVSHILGIGNPALWWLALLAYPALLVLAVVRRDWVPLAIMTFVLGQYLPWLAAARPAFLFYMTPVVPFIALAVAYAAGQAGRPALLRWVPAAVGTVVVAAFLFWYPILVGAEISREAWDLRILFPSWI
jgi:dolichyl-phosphate-mannose-protein mannosyltransferase